jgi:hypothetical protein
LWSHLKLSWNTTILSSHLKLSWNTTNLSSHLCGETTS